MENDPWDKIEFVTGERGKGMISLSLNIVTLFKPCPSCKCLMKKEKYITESLAAKGVFTVSDLPERWACSQCGYQEKVGYTKAGSVKNE